MTYPMPEPDDEPICSDCSGTGYRYPEFDPPRGRCTICKGRGVLGAPAEEDA